MEVAHKMEKLKNKGLISELWTYLKVRKKWWLLPIGALIIFGQSSALSPFIYALG